MAAPARTPDQRERDLEETARLYLQGWSQVRIAEKVGVSQPQISLDLKEIRKRWLESSIRDFDQVKAEELAKIDKLESTAWEAWERSVGDRTVTTYKTGVNGKGEVDELTERKEKLNGDPRYLTIVENCILRRCKIFGIDAEVKAQDINFAIAAVVKAGYIVSPPSE